MYAALFDKQNKTINFGIHPLYTQYENLPPIRTSDSLKYIEIIFVDNTIETSITIIRDGISWIYSNICFENNSSKTIEIWFRLNSQYCKDCNLPKVKRISKFLDNTQVTQRQNEIKTNTNIKYFDYDTYFLLLGIIFSMLFAVYTKK